MTDLTTPFDSARYLGSIIRVTTTRAELNIPVAARGSSSYAGYRIGSSEIGEFVAIRGELHAIIGRIVEVGIPKSERLSVENTRTISKAANPVGVLQLLHSFELETEKAVQGIAEYPKVGQAVYSAHSDFIKRSFHDLSYAESQRELDGSAPIAHLVRQPSIGLSFSADQLFESHCAVFGATGGGKSWTVAKLLEEVIRNGAKTILIDPSGEFRTLPSKNVHHVNLGGHLDTDSGGAKFVCFPHYRLTEQDLFAMFRPSALTQAPKFRAALKSLKLLAKKPCLANDDGLLKKANQPKSEYENAEKCFTSDLLKDQVKYDITKLADQIFEECVWPSPRNGKNLMNYGDYEENARSYCTTLVSRIESIVNSAECAVLFQTRDCEDVVVEIEGFMQDDRKSILCISVEHLPYAHKTREIVVNALGGYLLAQARVQKFASRSLLVALDEAHEFLNKTVGEEDHQFRLESFGLIAKGGRKLGLKTLFATQRPRDIPGDVLSQIGTFIVHRLSNDQDRVAIERSCGDLDAEGLRSLPVLGKGEAIIFGQGMPSAIPIQINPPKYKPESRGLPLW